MNEVRRKVLLDIFAAPSTLLPIAGGLTALMGAWALDGSPTLSFLGLSAILAGVGVLASRLVLNLERITQRAYDYVLEEKRRTRRESLDKLNERLVADQDPRTQNCLQELRDLYSRLKTKAELGQVSPAAFGVLEGVDKLFQSCLKQLEHSVELFETAQQMRGPARTALLKQRDSVVQEVCDAVIHLGETVERFHGVQAQQNRSELAKLRRELDESMRVAREVERRTEDLTRSAHRDARLTE